MTISDHIIASILGAGIAAPSGDNCQPWHYTVLDDSIRLYNVPERDSSLFNANQRASHIALGAFIENAVIAASAHHLDTHVTYFPIYAEPGLVAVIKLIPAMVVGDQLADVIADRCTNRRCYKGGILSLEQQQALVSSVSRFPRAQVRLFTGNDHKRIAQVIGLNDRLVFENRDLHAFLFEQIRWNTVEAEETRDGLDIRTLELAAPDAIAFRLFKSYDLVRVFNLVGLSRIIAANACKLAMSAAAVGVISLPESGQQDFLDCGRVLERIWLEATRQKLAFQLMTGITFLMGRVMEGDPGSLNTVHAECVREAYRTILSLIGNENEKPMIIFRIGYADPPHARSLRRTVQIPWDV